MTTQTIKRIVSTVILPIAVMAGAAHGQAGGSETEAEENQPLGRREWPAVTNGLVFIDGEYIPPPYTVSRERDIIFINGRKVDKGPPWPWRKPLPPPPVPKTEPVMPESITEKTTIYDEDYLRFVTDSRLYFFDTYGQEKGMDKMVELFKKLPFVSSASRKAGSPTGIELTLRSGERTGGDLVGPERKPLVMTKEQVQKSMDYNCDIYVRGLGSNHCFMFGNMTRRTSTAGFRKTLLPLADAMRTAKDETDFLAIMKTNQPPGGMSEAAFRAFYRHRDDLPKWEPRVREAVEKERR